MLYTTKGFNKLIIIIIIVIIIIIIIIIIITFTSIVLIDISLNKMAKAKWTLVAIEKWRHF